ncbi:MAG: NUDIX domain-containing protein [Bacteroidetes bacterium]|nr:NUDIX domain-containing protein [Bacteroidota bacterium]
MYKIFINDKPLIFTTHIIVEGIYAGLPVYEYSSLALMTHVREVEELHNKGAILLCEDVELAWGELNQHFKSIVAAGGLVYNIKNQLLLIKRLGKWDLPKGKMDIGESIEEAAIREVEEECGISQLSILRKAAISYHSYKLHGHRFIKVTHWFEMKTMYNGKLVPQAEESITDAIWIDRADLKPLEIDTYTSIRDILLEN